uniref:Cytochrome P450 n=1 Tax=Steinernema glaseri TaxID=37863 RepID=A0A1I8AVE8_9BILA
MNHFLNLSSIVVYRVTCDMGGFIYMTLNRTMWNPLKQMLCDHAKKTTLFVRFVKCETLCYSWQ